MPPLIEMKGKKFNRLVVIERCGSDKKGQAAWLCLCNCGKKTVVTGVYLRNGDTKSCGCLIKDTSRALLLKHGMFGTKVYKAWSGMIERCTNPNSKSWHGYGGRGIKVCHRWRNSFSAFLVDMGDKPEGMTLERKDNDGNYEPDNCKWATRKDQARNTRRNKLVSYNGETLCLSAWAEKTDISSAALWVRIVKLKWPIEKALTMPVRKQKRRLPGTNTTTKRVIGVR